MEPDPQPEAPEAFNIRDVTQHRQGGRPRGQAQASSLPLIQSQAVRAPGSNFMNQVQQYPRLMVGGCCVACVALMVIVLCSLGSVQPTEYGLRYNRVTKQVDTQYVYRSGRHLIGPTSSLLIFPATVQTLEFSNRSSAHAAPLTTRTAEGLTLHLHVAFQYHLKKDEIPDLYKATNIYYESLYMKIARDILLKAAANYIAPQYWTERTKIGADMQKLVDSSLGTSHAVCTGLQLLVIELPPNYEESIVATQVQKQGIKTRENEQQAALIRAQIQVMIANYQRNITVIINGAQANATLVAKQAEAQAAKMRIDAENVAFASVKTQLNLTPQALVGYQRNFAYSTKPNATFLFGLSNAVPVLGGGQHAVSSPGVNSCSKDS